MDVVAAKAALTDFQSRLTVVGAAVDEALAAFDVAIALDVEIAGRRRTLATLDNDITATATRLQQIRDEFTEVTARNEAALTEWTRQRDDRMAAVVAATEARIAEVKADAERVQATVTAEINAATAQRDHAAREAAAVRHELATLREALAALRAKIPA